jgi:hypothetical protein
MGRPRMDKKCSFWFCDDPHWALGYCHRHYVNLCRYGQALSPHNRDVKLLYEKAAALNQMLEAVLPMIADRAGEGLLDAIDGLLNETTNRPDIYKDIEPALSPCERCGATPKISIAGKNIVITCECKDVEPVVFAAELIRHGVFDLP